MHLLENEPIKQKKNRQHYFRQTNHNKTRMLLQHHQLHISQKRILKNHQQLIKTIHCNSFNNPFVSQTNMDNQISINN